MPLYGTLVSVIIASAVRYMPYGMRYAFTGALQIHPDLEHKDQMPSLNRLGADHLTSRHLRW